MTSLRNLRAGARGYDTDGAIAWSEDRYLQDVLAPIAADVSSFLVDGLNCLQIHVIRRPTHTGRVQGEVDAQRLASNTALSLSRNAYLRRIRIRFRGRAPIAVEALSGRRRARRWGPFDRPLAERYLTILCCAAR